MQRLHDAIDEKTPHEQAVQRCAREVLDSVPPVIWFIRREMRAFRHGTSLAQFRALAFVHRSPKVCLSGLAEHVGASLPTTSRLVQGLVKKGLLKRTGCTDDRRLLALAITESGEEVLNSAYSGTQNRLTDELKKLSTSERQNVEEAMRSLKELFGSVGLCEGYDGSLKLARPVSQKAKSNGKDHE
ncbi:MAG TPA: MarR family transcriptional regulator [Tepidisphaeraceae bacterium]|nr:MarR family transcriptional regulator [Tepidisphaeraceae bacterium]